MAKLNISEATVFNAMPMAGNGHASARMILVGLRGKLGVAAVRAALRRLQHDGLVQVSQSGSGRPTYFERVPGKVVWFVPRSRRGKKGCGDGKYN